MMHKQKLVVCAIVAALVSLAPMASAQSNSGPDVIVGSLSGIANYGSSGGVDCFAVGTTSCNVGNQNLLWQANNSNHPVIAQHMYRYMNGRMEMIGQSFLKHGFTALSGSLCDPCGGPGGSILSPGCSDPYGSSLNGSQGGLGPKCQVNATTGGFPYPFASPSSSGLNGTTFKRLQVHHDDLSSSLNPGASYYVEGHYIANDDTAAGNDDNNASYRPCNISTSGSGYSASTTGSTTREKPAIYAWQDIHDSDVVINEVDVPGDGRFIVALRVVPVTGGNYSYEFAVHNLNSHRSAASFTVDLPAGANVSNFGFHDVDYHSRDGDALTNGSSNGQPYDDTDWSPSLVGNSIAWSTSIEAVAPNGNALRWGTLYNFRFESDTPPGTIVTAHIGMYRSGSPSSVTTGLNLSGAAALTMVQGDNQLTGIGGSFALPFEVELSSILTGQPVQGVPVNFTGSGVTFTSPLTAVTDSNGRASVTADGSNLPMMGTIVASSGNASVSFNVYTRGLRVISTSSGTLVVMGSDSPTGSNAVPYIMYAGPANQPNYSTFIGDLCMNPFDPASAIVFCDGIGVFGFQSFMNRPCVGSPNLTNIYPGATVGLSGQTFAFQFIAYNSQIPGPSGLGWWISNCVNHTLN